VNKNNKSKDSSQKSFSVSLKEAQKELGEIERNLKEEMTELGYGDLTIEEFSRLDPDLGKPQIEASGLLSLKQRCKDFLSRKESLENIVCIEPSKLPEAVDAVENILVNNEQCDIYQMSGRLLRTAKVASLPKPRKAIVNRPHDSVVIKEVDQAFLTVFLTRIGIFVKYDGRSKSYIPIDCPERISRYLIAKGEWNVPVLRGLINTPTLRSDGSILDKPGYDKESGMLFIPSNWEFEKIPENPTKKDAEEAANSLLYLLKDFPFEDAISRSVAIAAILTPLIRKSIDTAPLFGFGAPKMACGKSLLANIVCMIATGKPNSVIAQAENEAEEKKRLIAVLSEGDPIVCYDNIEKPFGSTALCAILTQAEYKDRILGSSETRTVLTNTTFLATGNNLTFIGDISTRTLLCKLDPGMEHPEERLFDLDPIKYISENRGKLVRDGLVILRAYHVAGRPKQSIKQFGRFEEWSDWVRSPIVWIGMEDPCESRKSIENDDPVRLALGTLFCCWYEIFASEQVKAKEVVDATIGHDNVEAREGLKEAIDELVPGKSNNVSMRSLGKVFAKYKNRIENGFRLEQMDKLQGTTRWRIKKVS
jgi:hypothetical protein